MKSLFTETLKNEILKINFFYEKILSFEKFFTSDNYKVVTNVIEYLDVSMNYIMFMTITQSFKNLSHVMTEENLVLKIHKINN